jgi:HlyD family secretion protein
MSTQPSPAPFREPSQPGPAPVPVPEPPQPVRPRRRWMLVAAAAAVGLGGVLWLALRSEPAQQTGSGGVASQPSAVPVQVGPTRLRLSGETSARHYAQITIPVFRGRNSGREFTLMKVVEPGTFVKQGDVVLQLDPQNLLDYLDDLRDQLEAAENNVKKREAQLQVDWINLQQSLKVAKANWDKALLDLKAAEVNTDIEKEIARLNAEAAEAAYKQQLMDVEQQKISQAADLRNLQLEVERQRLFLKRHTADLEKFTVRAPISGLAVMVQTFQGGEMKQIREGDQVRAGMPVVKIVDLSSMQVEAKVSQVYANQFRIGQRAEIGIDAFPDLRFEGEIYSIGALATKGTTEQYYIRTVPVNITIKGTDPRLLPDLSAWAVVDTGPVTQAVADTPRLQLRASR